MAEQNTERNWWHVITRRDRFNRAEWALLGVSALALIGVVLMLAKGLH